VGLGGPFPSRGAAKGRKGKVRRNTHGQRERWQTKDEEKSREGRKYEEKVERDWKGFENQEWTALQ